MSLDDMTLAVSAPRPTNLAEALPIEMARVRDEVMPAYMDPELKGAGAFALAMMRASLDAAAKAACEGDVVGMIAAFQALQGYRL